jgi:hypothetical protein
LTPKTTPSPKMDAPATPTAYPRAPRFGFVFRCTSTRCSSACAASSRLRPTQTGGDAQKSEERRGGESPFIAQTEVLRRLLLLERSSLHQNRTFGIAEKLLFFEECRRKLWLQGCSQSRPRNHAHQGPARLLSFEVGDREIKQSLVGGGAS